MTCDALFAVACLGGPDHLVTASKVFHYAQQLNPSLILARRIKHTPTTVVPPCPMYVCPSSHQPHVELAVCVVVHKCLSCARHLQGIADA